LLPLTLSRALSDIFSLPMKRIFIAFALALALTGAMVVATVYGHTNKVSAESEIESPS
jgi:hypothetical protein